MFCRSFAVSSARVVLTLLFILWSLGARAELRVDDSAGVFDATAGLRYLFDPEERIDFETLTRPGTLESLPWASVSPGQVSLGSRDGAAWLLLDLSFASQSAWHLVFSNARFDEMDVWSRFDQGVWSHESLGILQWMSGSARTSNLPHVRLNGARGRAAQVIVRVKSSTPLVVSAQLQSHAEFHRLQTRALLALGVFTAIMGSLALFSFLIWVCMGRVATFLFVLLCVSQTGYSWSVDLFDFLYLWPDFPRWALASKNIFGACSNAILGFILIGTFRISGWRRPTAIAFPLLTLTAAIVSLFHASPKVDSAVGVFGLLSILAYLAVNLSLLRRDELAKYFLTGYCFFLVFTAVHIMQIFGIVPASSFTFSLPYVASVGLGVGFLLGFVRDITGINARLSASNVRLGELNASLQNEVEHRTRIAAELERERQRSIEQARTRILGEMSRNIAHEINTPLSILSMKLENARTALTATPPEPGMALSILATMSIVVKRAASVVQAMRLLARDGGREEPSRFGLDVLVEGVLLLSRERTGDSGIVFEVELGHKEIRLEGREGALFQLLSNLVNNAIDALASSPQVEKKIRIRTGVSGEELVVTVSDNGPGIPLGFEGNVFEPFFTTKPGASGMGLGLGLSRSTALEHGGDIVLESPRNPTTFSWHFPLAKVRLAGPVSETTIHRPLPA